MTHWRLKRTSLVVQACGLGIEADFGPTCSHLVSKDMRMDATVTPSFCSILSAVCCRADAAQFVSVAAPVVVVTPFKMSHMVGGGSLVRFIPHDNSFFKHCSTTSMNCFVLSRLNVYSLSDRLSWCALYRAISMTNCTVSLADVNGRNRNVRRDHSAQVIGLRSK